MKKLILLLGCFSLAACQPGGVESIPAIPGEVCSAINGTTFDTALKAYDTARVAVDALVDFKVVTPGTPTALKIADANDKVLAGFAVAENARQGCNAADYLAALNSAKAAIAEIRAALPKRN